MLEITNKNKFPVQILIRSSFSTRAMSVVNIPGIGKGKNTYLLEDEKITDYIHRAEKNGLISIKKINKKGD